MATNYWDKLVSQRTRRRRFVTGIGSFGAAAAFLAACGGDDDDEGSNGSSTGNTSGSNTGGTGSTTGSNGAPGSTGSSSTGSTGSSSGLVAPSVDESAQAKRGGVLPIRRTSDIVQMDPHLLVSGSLLGSVAFNRLFRVKPGYLEAAGSEVIGDMVASWEHSPDGLQVIMKLHPNHTWQDMEPVNARPVDAEDIVASWNRYAEVGQTRTNYSNGANPSAPIVSMTATDDSTVVMQLAEPNAGVTRLLATAGGGVYFIPREGAAGDYDPAKVGIGAGPWYLDHYEPSVRAEYKPHPGYYDKDSIHLGSVHEIVLPEYSSGVTQLQGGNLLWTGDSIPARLLQEDALASKKQIPELELRITDAPYEYSLIMYGYNPEKGSPFIDKRVRQAMTLSFDRELFFDAHANRQTFADEGIPIEAFYNTSTVAPLVGDYWLDPLGDDFGPNAKYFKQNLEEAKKLLAAAGFPDGLESEWVYTPDFGASHVQQNEILIGFAQEAGIKFSQNPMPNVNSNFRPDYIFTNGDFNAVAVTWGFNRGILDAVEMAISEYIPSPSVAYSGYMADGGDWKSGDPAYNELLKAARAEFDEERRIEMYHEFQRMEAENQYMPSFPGSAQQVTVTWPALRNFNVFHQGLAWSDLWIDETKPPLA